MTEEHKLPEPLSKEDIALVQMFVQRQTPVVCRAAIMSVEDMCLMPGNSKQKAPSRLAKRISIFMDFNRHEKYERAIELQKILLRQLNLANLYLIDRNMEARSSFIRGSVDACRQVAELGDSYGISATWNISQICSMIQMDAPAQEAQEEAVDA